MFIQKKNNKNIYSVIVIRKKQTSQAKIDQILKKVSEKGLHSLSQKEKN